MSLFSYSQPLSALPAPRVAITQLTGEIAAAVPAGGLVRVAVTETDVFARFDRELDAGEQTALATAMVGHVAIPSRTIIKHTTTLIEFERELNILTGDWINLGSVFTNPRGLVSDKNLAVARLQGQIRCDGDFEFRFAELQDDLTFKDLTFAPHAQSTTGGLNEDEHDQPFIFDTFHPPLGDKERKYSLQGRWISGTKAILSYVKAVTLEMVLT